ncbi:MAG: hypothetical protein ACK4N5_14135, partial [Myxococcales bacterium]
MAALLERARARQKWILALHALGLTLAGLLVAVPLTLAIASTGHPVARGLPWVVLAGGAAAFGVLYWRRVRTQLGTPASTAQLLASRLEDQTLRRDLVAAVELSRALEEDAPWSKELARAHVDRVGAQVGNADLSRALPDRPVRIAGAAFAASLVLSALA